jgi:hypothetical protein
LAPAGAAFGAFFDTVFFPLIGATLLTAFFVALARVAFFGFLVAAQRLR